MLENPLRVVSAPRMSKVRLVLHHAAQLVTAPLLSARALLWSESTRTLWGGQSHGRQLGLRLGAVELVFRRDGQIEETLTLAHQTMENACAWLSSRWGTSVSVPAGGLPHHAVRAGGRYPRASRASAQLEQEFLGAARALAEFAAQTGDAEPVVVSADSFAMTTVVSIRSRAGVGAVTVGFSPGDAANDESFWFLAAPHSQCRDFPREARLCGVGPLDRIAAPAAVAAVHTFLATNLQGLQQCAETSEPV